MWQTKFHTHTIAGKFIVLTLNFLEGRSEDKRFLDCTIANISRL
jgi:hypothetical protein